MPGLARFSEGLCFYLLRDGRPSETDWSELIDNFAWFSRGDLHPPLLTFDFSRFPILDRVWGYHASDVPAEDVAEMRRELETMARELLDHNERDRADELQGVVDLCHKAEAEHLPIAVVGP